jgi:hypothetical protein
MVATIPPVGPTGVEGPRTRDRYGIFSVAERDTLPEHASLGGVQWITGNCGFGVGYEVNCGASLATKTFSNTPSFETALPFVVYAARLCGTVGFTEEESQRLVIQKLKASEQAVVEAVFSDQLVGQSPGLANNPAVVTVPAVAGSNFADDIGRLEAAFYAVYGQQGVLHVPLRAGMHMPSQHLLFADRDHPMPGNSGVWRTESGTAVSIGNYSGNTPAGAAPPAGTQYIYMTPPVKIWAQYDSELRPAPIEGALNRATNQETWLVERTYVMGFECDVVFAVEASLPTQTTT